MTPSSASCARWRDTVLLGCPVHAAIILTEGKQRPVRSANATRFCNVQCRWRRTVRYRSRVTGTKASMELPELLQQPVGSGVHWAELARGKKALAKNSEVGKDRCRQTNDFPDSSRKCTPAALAGFCFVGCWCRGPPRTAAR